jgi:polar amino acid transport system substrate-binding protein
VKGENVRPPILKARRNNSPVFVIWCLRAQQISEERFKLQKILIFAVLCLFPFVVWAEKLPVVCHEFPPYNYRGDDGNITGASTEIVNEVLRRMGYEADIRLLPWNRALKMAMAGEAALLYTFSKSAEREGQFFFTDGFASVEVVFFKRKTDDIFWNVLSDVGDYRVGYVEGYNYGTSLMEALRKKTFKKTDVIGASTTVDYRQMLKLANGRIDLAVCPKTQCSWIIKKNSPQFDGVDYIDKRIGSPRAFYGGFSKKRPGAEALRDRFNQEYRKFVQEGGRDAILNKYGIAE